MNLLIAHEPIKREAEKEQSDQKSSGNMTSFGVLHEKWKYS
jgi:hypothetical protein